MVPAAGRRFAGDGRCGRGLWSAAGQSV